MKLKDIYEWKRMGWTEDAYKGICTLYAQKKNRSTASALFWVSNDLLLKRLMERRVQEALQIGKTMLGLLPEVEDSEGKALEAMTYAQKRLQQSVEDCALASTGAELGRWGEELAADFLRERGYAVLERNWRSAHRDIDIVAKDRETVVFVEVKTRRNRIYTDPELAVDATKRSHLLTSINHYLRRTRCDAPVRFDIITVVGMLGHTPEIRHIQNVRLEE